MFELGFYLPRALEQIPVLASHMCPESYRPDLKLALYGFFSIVLLLLPLLCLMFYVFRCRKSFGVLGDRPVSSIAVLFCILLLYFFWFFDVPEYQF